MGSCLLAFGLGSAFCGSVSARTLAVSVAEYMALKRRLSNALIARVRPGAGGWRRAPRGTWRRHDQVDNTDPRRADGVVFHHGDVHVQGQKRQQGSEEAETT